MDKIKKRKVDVVVISDIHLGTYGCHAKELLHYLNSSSLKGTGLKTILKLLSIY